MARSFKSLRFALVVSFFCHTFCFVIFEPILGESLSNLNFAQVSFLGSIFQASELVVRKEVSTLAYQDSFLKTTLVGNIVDFSKSKRSNFSYLAKVKRPLFNLSDDKEKIFFINSLDSAIIERYKKEATLLFNPRLPHSFLIYFRDRQKAHIEFSFYISSQGKVAFINRKISSGNLEADLLALRYIARCLKLVEEQFPADSWQTAKIDLTRKDD